MMFAANIIVSVSGDEAHEHATGCEFLTPSVNLLDEATNPFNSDHEIFPLLKPDHRVEQVSFCFDD